MLFAHANPPDDTLSIPIYDDVATHVADRAAIVIAVISVSGIRSVAVVRSTSNCTERKAAHESGSEAAPTTTVAAPMAAMMLRTCGRSASQAESDSCREGDADISNTHSHAPHWIDLLTNPGLRERSAKNVSLT